MDKSFSSVPHNNEAPYEDVEFKVKINSLNDYYIVKKIKGELGECTIETISDNEYERQNNFNVNKIKRAFIFQSS